MAVLRYLVTVAEDTRFYLWWSTALYTNWLDVRFLLDGRQTWLVMVYEPVDEFLAVARAVGATVELVHGGDDTETYELIVGEPGTGWNPELWDWGDADDHADDDDPHKED